MTTIDPSGYSEAGAHLFTWLADKVLGGAKKAFGWGWERAQWAKAQDRYDARIVKDYGQIRIFGQNAPKSLKDIFTDVYVLDTPTAYQRFDPAALTEHLWNEDRSLSFRHEERRPGEELLAKGSKFYILGKPGAGKTTFLRHLAVREAQRGRWGPCLGKIPIFVSLKQFGEVSQSLFDFIVDEFAVCGFSDAAPFVETLLKSGQALVLFDGLDEVSTTGEHDRRGEVTQMLAQFARQYGECHIVVTCRIAAVDFTFEPAFAYLEMADFAPDQVEAFVRAWFWDENDKDKGAALAEGMLAALELPEHKGIRDLSRNPLLLTLLCLNYAETLSFPTRRVEIYKKALGALMKKWDSSRYVKRGGDLYKELSPGRKQQMFARIAFDVMERGEIVLPQADLERRLVNYLASVPKLPDAIDIDGEAVLQEIIAQHGIFAEQAGGLYSFAHFTFQEYFAACHIADSTGSDALDVLLNHIDDDKWREVFLLTASLLADASAFLTAFEATLQRSVASHPQLTAWLKWIDDRSRGSQTPYRQSAIRVYFARQGARAGAYAGALAFVTVRRHVTIRSFNLARELDCELDRELDRDFASAHALALALALARNRNRARDLSPDRDRALALARDIVRARSNMLDISKQIGRTDLSDAIAGIAVPKANAPVNAWQRYAIELEQIIEASRALAHYRQLQEEIDGLEKEQRERGALSGTDLNALIDYAKRSRLFYDCLQLAYTPDRRAFEERIFLPPP